MRYRMKPVVIEARQYDGANAASLVEWAAGFTSDPAPLQVLGAQLVIATLEPGDYIIRGVHGEFYPCKPDIFAQTYEPADPPDGELAIDDAKREAEAHVEQLRAGGYEGAVIQEVYLRAEAAVREALDAIKRAHAVVDDLCNGRRWTMSVPARPDADPDLVIGDALTKAERVIRSLADVPTAREAGE